MKPRRLGDIITTERRHEYKIYDYNDQGWPTSIKETLVCEAGTEVQVVSVNSFGYAISRPDGRRLYNCGWDI